LKKGLSGGALGVPGKGAKKKGEAEEKIWGWDEIIGEGGKKKKVLQTKKEDRKEEKDLGSASPNAVHQRSSSKEKSHNRFRI